MSSGVSGNPRRRIDEPPSAPRRRHWSGAVRRWLGAPPRPRLIHLRPPTSSAPAYGRTAKAIEPARVQLGETARRGDPFDAYIASAVEIAQEAESLASGSPPKVRTCGLHILAVEAIEAIADLAAAKSVVVALDSVGPSRAEITDPERLRRVPSHLIFRALIGSVGDGRIDVAVENLDAVNQIAVRPSRGPRQTSLHDLGGAARLIQALGAVLVAEPSDPAPAALCIALPVGAAPVAARPS